MKLFLIFLILFLFGVFNVYAEEKSKRVELELRLDLGKIELIIGDHDNKIWHDVFFVEHQKGVFRNAATLFLDKDGDPVEVLKVEPIGILRKSEFGDTTEPAGYRVFLKDGVKPHYFQFSSDRLFLKYNLQTGIRD